MFPNCSLGWIDVSAFKGLVVLDLRANRFHNQVVGLHHLKKLRVLNLHDNPKLDSEGVIKELTQAPAITTLEHVWLAGDPKRVDNSWIQYLLRALGSHNHKLCLLEGKPVDLKLRVNVYAETHPMAGPKDIEQYHLNLAMCVSATPFEGREYSPDQLLPGVQYKKDQVTQLLRSVVG